MLDFWPAEIAVYLKNSFNPPNRGKILRTGVLLQLVVEDLLLEELQEYLKSLKLPGYRANQIYDWVFHKKVNNWDEMTNLPKDMRRKLAETGMELAAVTPLTQVTATDGTVKFLFELADRERIESVFLPETERNTVCFSTQAGCGMGCIFCATGQNGLIRNLTPAEIVDQIIRIEALTGSRVTNLVAMGQGEPLANYDALMKAIRIINHPLGLGIGARRITISTCGIIPGILKLAEEPFQVNLAVSLHAAADELRDRIMPVNKVYPLNGILDATKVYIQKTGRRVTFEYTLMHEINDRPADRESLIRRLSGMLCHVNIIPFNPVPGSELRRSLPERVREFAAGLNRAGIETTVRKERGSTLTAACGQLQSKRLE
jgi:23S rRNA (adenine2503-C2)-methyltransferase